MKISRVSVYQAEKSTDTDILLKSKCTYYIYSHIPWAPSRGGQSDLGVHELSLKLVALGRELKGQPSRFLR